MQVTTPDFIPQPFAQNGEAASIPANKTEFGRASWNDGFPTETALPLNAGGIPPHKADFNGTLKALSQHTFFGQSGCLYPWDASLNYLKNSHVVGSDGMEYAAKLANGPDVSGVGAQDPTLDTDKTYWANVSDIIGTGSGGGIIPQPADTLPLVDSGMGAIGTSTKYARADHQHPESGVVSTIIYPNGGSVGAEANVSSQQRYVMDNPFPGYFVQCEAQVKYNGKWGATGWNSTDVSFVRGTAAYQLLPDDKIVVQTGMSSVLGSSYGSGNPFGDSSFADKNDLPCRVRVTRLGKM